MSNITGPQFRYRLELRASADDKWMDTGFAFLLPQEEDAKPEISFVTNHFSAEIISEKTARADPGEVSMGLIPSLSSQIASLEATVLGFNVEMAEMRAKIRVLADENLALKANGTGGVAAVIQETTVRVDPSVKQVFV